MQFIDRHEYLTDQVTVTTYEGGERMVCNASDAPYDFEGHAVAPKSWLLVK